MKSIDLATMDSAWRDLTALAALVLMALGRQRAQEARPLALPRTPVRVPCALHFLSHGVALVQLPAFAQTLYLSQLLALAHSCRCRSIMSEGSAQPLMLFPQPIALAFPQCAWQRVHASLPSVL